MLKMFCEADGTPSMRRVLAFLCYLSFVAMGVMAFRYASSGWTAFIPSALSLAAMLFLLFFTTWSDISAIIRAAKDGK